MLRFAMLVLACAGILSSAHADETLRVGSKRFTESYILGEILTQTAARTGPAEHKQGLGNTAIVLGALRSGAIDVYPEYLGTIDLEILKNPQPTSLEAMRAALRPLGLGVAVPLAVATDCNPGTSPMTSLLLALNMACTLWRLTPLEALRGVTVNAARALGLLETGTLAPGQRADFALWDIARPADLAYAIGANPCRGVVRAGVWRDRVS